MFVAMKTYSTLPAGLTAGLSACLLTCCIFCISSFGSSHTQAQYRFGVEESVEYAIENNPRFRNQAMVYDRTRLRVKDGVADYYPNIQGSFDYEYNFAIRRTIFPDFLSPTIYQVLERESLVPTQQRQFNVLPAQFGTSHVATVGLSVQQRLIDVGYILYLQGLSLSVPLAGASYDIARNELVSTVHASYYYVLIAEKQHALAEENTARLTRLLAETTLLYENGFAEKVDYQRITVQVNAAKIEQGELFNTVAQARRLLGYTLGLEVGTSIAITDSLTEVHLSERQEGVSLLEDENFLVHHPEYKVRILEEQLAKIAWRSQKGSLAPRLNFRANVGYNAGANVIGDLFASENWFFYGLVGLNMQVPIFQGFKLSTGIQQKKLSYIEAQNNIIDVQGRLLQEQAEAKANFTQRLAALAAQKENVTLSYEVYQISEKEYQQGVGSAKEVLDAALAYSSAQTDQYFALYNALVALSAYEKAVGSL